MKCDDVVRVPAPTPESPQTAQRQRALSRRSLRLDFLRGLAIVLVLFAHCPIPRQTAGLFNPVVSISHHVGWTGVDLFFVLSGFLIGGLLMKELSATGHLDLKRFWIRRAFKIWPSYIVYLVYLAALILLAGGQLHVLWPNVLHVQNYFGSWRTHTWSLAVEEHFYLFIAIAIYLLARARRLQWLVGVCACLFVGCLIVRLAHWYRYPNDNSLHWLTHTRSDSLAAGVLIAYAYRFHRRLFDAAGRSWPLLAVVAIALLAPLGLIESTHPYLWTAGYTTNYLAYALVLIVAVVLPLDRHWLRLMLSNVLTRLVAWVGVYSYSIYLWHPEIVLVLEKWMLPRLTGFSPTVRFVLFVPVYLSLSVLTGVLMAKVIEVPCLRLRESMFPPKQAGALRTAEPGQGSVARGTFESVDGCDDPVVRSA